MQDCILYNCDARIEMSVEDAMYEPQGNGIEVGMLRFLLDNEIPVNQLLVEKSRVSTLETCIPFNPVKKRQLVVIKPSNNSSYVRLVLKGAPEYVIIRLIINYILYKLN